MMPNRQQAPALNIISGLPEFQIESQVLSNQIPVQYINAGSEEMVKLQVTFPAGIIYQSKSLQAHFTGRMLKEGTNIHSASELAEKIDFFGAYLDIKINRDQSIIHLISLNKYLPKLLAIITEFLSEPSFPEKELKVMIEQEKQSFLHRMQKGKVQAQRAFGKELFGANHPYGKHAEIEDFDVINTDNLKSFFKTHYHLSRAKIYMSGLITPEILQILDQHMGSMNFNSEAIPFSDPDFTTTPLQSNALIIEKPEALQTAIKMGKICPNRDDAIFPAFALTQTILGGFFGSRLMQNIREDKGYTYGIHSNIQHLKHSSVFSIASEVGSDVAQPAMKEIGNELNRLCEETVNDEELNLVKNYMSGSLLRSLNGPFALGEMIKTIDEFQLDAQYFQKFLDGIQQTTAEQVQQIAQKHLQLMDMTTVRVGK
jgi:predicted Zn-dependent peptidase